MRAVWIGIVAIVLIVGGVVMLSRSDDPQVASDNSADEYTKVQAELDSNDALLYDVRAAEEYRAAHVEGAINLSLQDIEAGRMPDTAKDTKLYLYCRSGNRSAQAAQLLREAGYTDIVDLGGMSDVTAMGGELVADEAVEVLP